MSNNIEAKWVVGAYQGERAKSVMAHAAAGIGYRILQNSGKGPQSQILAAFQTADFPIPPHLTEVKDPIKIQQLEKSNKKIM
jgi:hypothetical protein